MGEKRASKKKLGRNTAGMLAWNLPDRGGSSKKKIAGSPHLSLESSS